MFTKNTLHTKIIPPRQKYPVLESAHVKWCKALAVDDTMLGQKDDIRDLLAFAFRQFYEKYIIKFEEKVNAINGKIPPRWWVHVNNPKPIVPKIVEVFFKKEMNEYCIKEEARLRTVHQKIVLSMLTKDARSATQEKMLASMTEDIVKISNFVYTILALNLILFEWKNADSHKKVADKTASPRVVAPIIRYGHVLASPCRHKR